MHSHTHTRTACLTSSTTPSSAKISSSPAAATAPPLHTELSDRQQTLRERARHSRCNAESVHTQRRLHVCRARHRRRMHGAGAGGFAHRKRRRGWPRLSPKDAGNEHTHVRALRLGLERSQRVWKRTHPPTPTTPTSHPQHNTSAAVTHARARTASEGRPPPTGCTRPGRTRGGRRRCGPRRTRRSATAAPWECRPRPGALHTPARTDAQCTHTPKHHPRALAGERASGRARRTPVERAVDAFQKRRDGLLGRRLHVQLHARTHTTVKRKHGPASRGASHYHVALERADAARAAGGGATAPLHRRRGRPVSSAWAECEGRGRPY